MNAAQEFMKQLQEGKTTEAIKTIKTSLKERSEQLIESKQIEVMESYGFQVEKKYMKEEDKDKEDDKDMENNDSSDDDDKENKKKEMDKEDE